MYKCECKGDDDGMEELVGVACTTRDKSVSTIPYSIPFDATTFEGVAVDSSIPSDSAVLDGGEEDDLNK